MGLQEKILDIGSLVFRKGISLLGKRKSSLVYAHLAEYFSDNVVVDTKYGEIKFFCPSKLAEFRAATFFTKEPETLEWIVGFDEGDVLWDVGANVGVYSLYAAKKGHRVLAFEPSPHNYCLLNKNIEINVLQHKITAYCMAMADKSGLDYLYLSDEGRMFGGAENRFGGEMPFVISIIRGLTPSKIMDVGAIGYRIDTLLETYDLPFPNHIKIDVDGNESNIVEGVVNTLSDRRVKSVLVELDTQRKGCVEKVFNILSMQEFRLFKKAHAPEYNNSVYSNIYNYIFIR